ncbi:hypothetical protein RSAG8_05774, partial [Rhizoctonia solani AG-8 WAC10335]
MSTSLSLSPPHPPESFPGAVPELAQSPFSINHLVQAICYTYQLHSFSLSGNAAAATTHAEAMIHQTRLANAIIQEKYPTEFHNSPPVNNLVQQISDAVAKSVNARIDALNTNIREGKEGLESRLIGTNKRLDDVTMGTNKRLDDMATRTNQRFDDMITGTNKRLDDMATRTNQRFDDLDQSTILTNRRLDEANKRLEQRTTTINKFMSNTEKLLGEHTNSLTSLESKLRSLERTTGELKTAVANIPGGDRFETTVKALITTELGSLKADVAALRDRLDGPGGLTHIDNTTVDISNRLSRAERTQRLQINSTRPLNGPWLVISSEDGRDPTRPDTGYDPLHSNDMLCRMSDWDLYDYLSFYNLVAPSRRRPSPDIVRSRWDESALIQARNTLRDYITTPR